MKKIVLFAFVGFTIATTQAQDINDAMRFAQDNQTGTARFRAMSGAFGALGGDLSSININPAGSVIFANSQVGITLGNYNVKNNSNYFGTSTSQNDNSFDISQAGAVYVFKNEDSKSDWKKFALALNYENTKNLDNSIFSAGTNPTNSIANYFLSYANQNGGVPLELLQTQSGESIQSLYSYLGSLPNFDYPNVNGYQAQQAMLGYQAFILNENDPANNQYNSGVAAGGNYYQEYSMQATGYNGKLSFNASGQYKDKFFFGINLNSHFVDYRQSTSFFESNTNNTSTDDFVQRLRFNNDLYTYGNGFSFQLGTIFKPTQEVRLGIAYESPTWMRLSDELSQSIVSVSSSSEGELQPVIVDPQLTMVYEPYRLQTPGKWTGSFAYVFGKKGLISLDYALKDYSNTKYRPSNDFTSTNDLMSNVLDVTNEFRLGAEYKIEKVSLRAGYRFEQSPYKNGETIGDLTGYSGGLGYNFGATKLDLAYSFYKRDYSQQFFSQGFTDSSTINSKNNNISLTVLFEL
jgi:hypothetical protein